MSDAQADAAPLRLEDHLCFALYSTLHAVGKTYGTLLPDLSLTYPQYLVMLVLWEGNNLGVKQIGERLFLDSGTLTPLLKRLEAAGLLRRERDSADERQVRITLTKQGSDLRAKASCLPEQVATAMNMPAGALARLRDDLFDLRSRLIASRSVFDESSAR